MYPERKMMVNSLRQPEESASSIFSGYELTFLQGQNTLNSSQVSGDNGKTILFPTVQLILMQIWKA